MDPPVVYTYVCVPLGDHNLADVLATVPEGGRLHSIYRDTVIFEVVKHWLGCDVCRGSGRVMGMECPDCAGAGGRIG